MRGEAAEILRRHVKMRRNKGLKSYSLDEPGSQRAPNVMSESDRKFLESSRLVRGVPEMTLQLIEEWVCGSLGSTWTVDAVLIRGEPRNIPKEQVAVPLKLTEAAANLGWKLSHQQCMSLYREAQNIVLDNLVERAAREVDDSYAK